MRSLALNQDLKFTAAGKPVFIAERNPLSLWLVSSCPRRIHTRSCKAFVELPPCRWPSRRLLPTIRPASGDGMSRQLGRKTPNSCSCTNPPGRGYKDGTPKLTSRMGKPHALNRDLFYKNRSYCTHDASLPRVAVGYNPSAWSPAPAAGRYVLTTPVCVLPVGGPSPFPTRRPWSQMAPPADLHQLPLNHVRCKALDSRQVLFSSSGIESWLC